MRGVLFPVDVVVVKGADHQRIDQGGVYRRHFIAEADDGCLFLAAHGGVNVTEDVDISGMVATPGAANGIVEIAFYCVDDIIREVVELEFNRKFSDFARERFFHESRCLLAIEWV